VLRGWNRLEGELLLAYAEADVKIAEASFRKAIAMAREQGARSFELRASMTGSPKASTSRI
jgi:hypothetical protein